MLPCHIGGVRELLTECFGDNAWSADSISAQLDKEVSYCAVALDEDRVAGYIAFEKILDEGSIVELAVLPEYRRKGIGRRLIELMLTSVDGMRTVCLEVRASNIPAIALYEAMGFRSISVRRGYYDSPREDAVIMIYQIPVQYDNEQR